MVEAEPLGDRLGKELGLAVLVQSFHSFTLEIDSKVCDRGVFTVSIKFNSYILTNKTSICSVLFPHTRLYFSFFFFFMHRSSIFT